MLSHCSWRAGWRSLLLRAYEDPCNAEEFTTAATSDQLIVLVVKGSYRIEVKRRGQWFDAHYRTGSLGMTAAGEEATLRWFSDEPSSALHLHLPGRTIRAAAEALWGRDPQRVEMPNALLSEDPTIQQVILGLREASLSGVPDIYAETAADFLAVHLLQKHAGSPASVLDGREEGRLRRVNDFMRAHLSEPLSLEDLAREAGLSRFHLLRLFKKTYGETPFARLTRLRMERASHLLSRGDESVTQIALECGYDNASHFATAFRRSIGVPPTAYRLRRG